MTICFSWKSENFKATWCNNICLLRLLWSEKMIQFIVGWPRVRQTYYNSNQPNVIIILYTLYNILTQCHCSWLWHTTKVKITCSDQLTHCIPTQEISCHDTVCWHRIKLFMTNMISLLSDDAEIETSLHLISCCAKVTYQLCRHVRISISFLQHKVCACLQIMHELYLICCVILILAKVCIRRSNNWWMNQWVAPLQQQ